MALSMLFYSTFSSVSVWLVAPFINTLFSGEQLVEQVQEKPDETETDIDIEEIDLSTLEKIRQKLNAYTNRLVVGKDKEDTLANLCIIILVVFLVKNIAAYFGQLSSVKIQYAVVKELRDKLYDHFCHLSLNFFNKQKSGILISHVLNDVGVINNSFNQNLTTLLRDPLQLILSLFIVIIISWRLTLFTVIILPISGFIITKIGQSLKRKSKRTQEKIADITSILQETISGIRIVKAFAMEKFEIDRFKRGTESYRNVAVRKSGLKALSSPLSEFIAAVIGVIILWYGGKLVFKGELLSPEDFIRFILVVFSMMHPIKQVGKLNNKIQEGLAAAQRVFDILDTPIMIKNSANPVKKDELNETIEFENVYFRYTENDPVVLHDINLKINIGEVVALVGPSGSGKSTIVDMVCRFYDPIDGKITLDEIDLRDIDVQSLRKMIGFVTQEPILFNDTIRSNIAYGLHEIDEEQLKRAAKAANAHGFIMDLPQGYETVIGDRGVRLSGGEKQRISIARAIFKNPPILIFDEATSSLDTQSEMLVQTAIENLIKDRTSIVIAHRMSTIRNADKIVVLERGNIVGIGRHEELMETCALYQKLYNLQFRSE